MENPVRVAIAGISGKMGKCSMTAVDRSQSLEIAGGFGRKDKSYVGKDLSEFLVGSNKSLNIQISKDIHECLKIAKPDVLLEFTQAESALEHARIALENGVSPVIGTSGLSKDDFAQLENWSEKYNLGSMVVPNFSIGAVLMMEFAKQAGKYFDNVEIIEMHGTKKLDAPSGTATYTANKLDENGKQFNPQEVEERELLEGVRGGQTESGVRIHSLRIPGLISHQDVVFGSAGELLEIKHNSFNTDCFLKGIERACLSIGDRKGLTLGLENLL